MVVMGAKGAPKHLIALYWLLLTSCPESLSHTASKGPVARTEELHDHAVADTLQTLDDNPLQKPETHEDHQSLDKVEPDPNQTLTVQTEQHYPLPTKPREWDHH